MRSLNVPDFIIAGAQRAGTTTLFQYLAGHHKVSLPLHKEIHYFDHYYYKGPVWYSKHFRKIQPGQLLFEASPYYLRHPLAPKRAKEANPSLKIIIMLRDPMKRAISHYTHGLAIQKIQEPIEATIARELRSFRSEDRRLEAGNIIYSHIHHRCSLLHRGLYWEQIERWLEYFPREQLLIVKSEDMFDTPQHEFNKICDFLEIVRTEIVEPLELNKTQQFEPGLPAREMMKEFLAPANEQLNEQTGISWNT